MRRGYSSLLILFIFFIFSPFLSEASDIDLEKDLQMGLEQSKAIIEKASEKLKTGNKIIAELIQLKTIAEDIKTSHMLLQERFRLREEGINALGTKASERHRIMSEGYRKALEEYLSLIDSLPSESSQQTVDSIQQIISNLQTLLERILPKERRPIFGSLPYRNLNYPSREPNQDPPIKPAYKGGNKVVSPDDLKSTTEAPISQEIATLAQSLNWNPVLIYEWVKNNIETEWYWGCMKGAEETLRQKSGNDCDQAALLVALLRASGFPSRYVRGTIEFFAGRDEPITKVKNLTGIDDPWKIAEFFQKAGIPYKPIIAGGKISNFQIEHIWVESQIPYANYRGAIIDEYGKTWLGLDTSIKVKGYEYNNPIDIFQQSAISGQLSALGDKYLSTIQTQTPLEYIQSYLNSELGTQNSGLTYNDFLRTHSIIPEIMKILPASMQFTQIKITHEYTEIPDELKHKVRFIATTCDMQLATDTLFDITIDTLKLSNQKIAISYEPETVEDQEIINSYGGLDNTPAYLVRLRPVLTVNGEKIVVAKDGLPMGTDYELTIELRVPSSELTGSEKITNTHIAGNLAVIGIVSQKSTKDTKGHEEENAETILFKEVINYIDRWNQAEDELASLMQLTITRPIPTVVTIGGVIDVTYVLDTPHEFEWKGVYVDADLRAIETAFSGQQSAVSTAERQKTFMQISALQGSILENRIFEDDFQVESISTAKLIQLSNQQSAVSGQLLTIDKSNINTILPTLPFDDNIKEDITNSVNQNLTIRIPQSEIVYQDWTGIGYIKENLDTGESGYMLSGMIAGGMTAVKKELWINQDLANTLSLPSSKKTNTDPEAVVRIVRLGDYQSGIVGTKLSNPIEVIALDGTGRPVQNVLITFKAIAGGGKVQGEDKTGKSITALDIQITVTTGSDGIARARLTLGEQTNASPYYRQETNIKNERYWELVGLNLVSVYATTQLRGNIYTDKPFEAYGRPAEADRIEKIYPTFDIYGIPNIFAGTIWIKVVDKYGNSISSKNVSISIQNNPSAGKNAKLYTNINDCPGVATLDCPNAKEYDAQNPLEKVTEHFGVLAYVILGNTENTRYTIRAITKRDYFNQEGKRVDTDIDLNSVDFTFYTSSIGGEAAEQYLSVMSVYTIDEKGNKIDAGIAGKQFSEPLKAAMFYTEEGYEVAILDNCTSNCYYLKGKGTFTTIPVNNGKVDFNIVLGGGSVNPVIQTTATDGHYSTSLILGQTPAKNVIQATGRATVTVPTIDPSSGYITTTQKELSDTTAFEIWGVKATVEPNQLILLNEDGYPTADVVIRYSIQPAEYKYLPQNLYLDFYEKDKDGNESWMGFIQADMNGNLILSRGTAKFNAENTYYAELILHRGTKVEIRSDKVELIVAKMSVVNETGKEMEELRFGDGTNAEKRYHIELRSSSILKSLSCSNIQAKISTRKKDNSYVDIPSGEYPGNYLNLSFEDTGLLSGKCVSKNLDTATGTTRDSFIITNLPNEALGEVTNITAPLYGGIGNKFAIELQGALTGYQKDLLIEPVGVIVIGIDGLRQDVLYPPELDAVNDGGKYRINISDLQGIKQILAGYDQPEERQRYKLLLEVTAIFPSITFASWASIFTGKLPNETGIPGNEFFARDLLIYDATTQKYSWKTSIPAMERNPIGMITISEGTFPRNNSEHQAITPLSGKWQDSPQNNLLQTSTVYDVLNSDNDFKRYFNEKGGKSAVVVFQHYAHGVDEWVTLDRWEVVKFVPSVAYGLDEIPGDKAEAWLSDNLLTGIWPFKKRNDKPFPGVFVIYFAGLDHEAHDAGMSGYTKFFKETTDDEIKDIAKWLKKYDEFDNKIFIIVSDHGHTEMPEFGLTTITIGSKQKMVIPDTSCKLQVEGFEDEDIQLEEKYNNNLHIWEMGEVMRAVGEIIEQTTGVELNNKVLSPKEIAELFKDPETGNSLPNGATEKTEDATIIAAFNGPMAHIYVKGSDWSAVPDINKIKELAEILRVTLQGARGGDSPLAIFPPGVAGRLGYKIGRLSGSIDEILIRDGGIYKVYTVDSSSGVPQVVLKDISNYFTDLYVDAEKRINRMNHEKRSGDIVLIMKDNMSDPVDERFTTGSACKSWHGSLTPSDSHVPFIVAYPGGNKIEIEKILQKDTICKTDYTNCKGNWQLTDIVKEIISEQYK